MTICLRCVESENTLEISGFVYPNPLALRARGFGSTNPLFLVCSPQHKLSAYGIRGLVNKWFASYLTDRCQYVHFETNSSSRQVISCGVPQGSILGPLLYLIFVNDIHKSCDSNILSFADDTTLYLSHRDIASLYSNANRHINNLYDWFCANKLSLNAQKTNILFLDQNTNNATLAFINCA